MNTARESIPVVDAWTRAFIVGSSCVAKEILIWQTHVIVSATTTVC